MFRAGDMVLVQVTDSAGSVRHGDLVVVRETAPGPMTAHRLLKVRNCGIITKGDANLSFDPPVRSEQVKGVVVAHAAEGGPVAYAHTYQWRVLMWLSWLVNRLEALLWYGNPYRSGAYRLAVKSLFVVPKAVLAWLFRRHCTGFRQERSHQNVLLWEDQAIDEHEDGHSVCP
jgi:hypothetical protein